MTIPEVNLILSGAIIIGFLLAGLFFWRFLRATRDRLLGFFAFAFWVMALERIVLLILGEHREYMPYVYFLRLAAFSIIVLGVIDKNRNRS